MCIICLNTHWGMAWDEEKSWLKVPNLTLASILFLLNLRVPVFWNVTRSTNWGVITPQTIFPAESSSSFVRLHAIITKPPLIGRVLSVGGKSVALQALMILGRLNSRRWQSFPTAPDGTGLTCGQHIESHRCIFSFPSRTVTSLFK
jgi:hypothetical protein